MSRRRSIFSLTSFIMQIAVKAFNKSAGGICHKNLPEPNWHCFIYLRLVKCSNAEHYKICHGGCMVRKYGNLGVLNGRTVKIMT